VYEIVLQEGRPADILAYVEGGGWIIGTLRRELRCLTARRTREIAFPSPTGKDPKNRIY
jgi:hypothetical protein